MVASSVGGMLEWYDFVLYGYLAPIIAAHFFPSSKPFLAQLATFGVFAAGFISRPLGGLLLGHIGDRYGRKPVLWLSVVLMGGSTVGIGCLPDFAQAGILAPFLLVSLRTMQGLSIGGEFTGSTIYMAELASTKNRAYMASWPEFGCLCGFLAGSGIGTLLTALLTEPVMYEWGWRIPFWIGGGIAVFGVLIRQHLYETEAFLSIEKSGEVPILLAFRHYWKVLLQMMFLVMASNVSSMLVLIYFISTYAKHTSLAQSYWVSNIGLAITLIMTPLGCMLSDKIGRKPVLYMVSAGLLFGSFPLWWMLHQSNVVLTAAGMATFSVLFGIGLSVSTVTVIELLPTELRCSGVSVGYNLCLALFGGTTPVIAVYLVHSHNDIYAPVYYLAFASTLSWIAAWLVPEMNGKPLYTKQTFPTRQGRTDKTS